MTETENTEFVSQWEEFTSNYTLVENNEFEGEFFQGNETEFLEVAKTSPNRVWTLTDDDGNETIQAGYRLVNRVGYYVTEEEAVNPRKEFYCVKEYDADEEVALLVKQYGLEDVEALKGLDAGDALDMIDEIVRNKSR